VGVTPILTLEYLNYEVIFTKYGWQLFGLLSLLIQVSGAVVNQLPFLCRFHLQFNRVRFL